MLNGISLQAAWVELGRVKVGAARQAHLQIVSKLRGPQVPQNPSSISSCEALNPARQCLLQGFIKMQVVRLEGVPEEQGFSVAARAEGVIRPEELVVQPGEPQVLQVTWQPAAAGAVRGVLHLAYGDKPTRVQARSCPSFHFNRECL